MREQLIFNTNHQGEPIRAWAEARGMGKDGH